MRVKKIKAKEFASAKREVSLGRRGMYVEDDGTWEAEITSITVTVWPGLARVDFRMKYLEK